MRRWFRIAIALVVATGAAAGRGTGLVAQQDTTSRNTSRKAASDTSRVSRLAPIVVTASRTPMSAARLGFAVSELSRDELAREPTRYSVDALRRLPGLSLDEANGPGGPTIIRIRGGEEVYGQILVDGVAINQSGGFFDFQGVALSNLERIEVVRGPQSALYGSSAVSGVVQFLTRRGVAGPPRLEIEGEGGTAAGHGGGGRLAASVAGGTGSLLYSAGYGFTADRGRFALPNDLRTHDGSLRLDLAPSGRIAAHAMVRYLHTDGRLPVRDPGATRAPLDPNARNNRGRLAASGGVLIATGANWQQDFTVTVYHDDFVYDDARDGVSATDFFVFDANFRLRSRFTQAALEYAVSRRMGAAGNVAAGVRWQRESQHDVTSGDFGDGDLALSRPTTALFAETSYSFGSRVDVLGGTRLEWTRDVPAELTPRAAVVVHVVPDQLSLRAAAGRAFKMPDLQQRYLDNPFIVANPDLRPETSTSWEIGARGAAVDGRLRLGVTYFDQRFRDLIRTVGIEGASQQTNKNLGRSNARGVEAELQYDIGDRWQVGWNAAWIRTRIEDGEGLDPSDYPVGGTLPGRPAAVVTAWLEVDPTDQLSLTIRGGYVGSTTVLSERFSGDRERIAGRTLLGMTAIWRFAAGLEMYGRIDNAFDREYQTAFDRPGIRRTVALGARLAP